MTTFVAAPVTDLATGLDAVPFVVVPRVGDRLAVDGRSLVGEPAERAVLTHMLILRTAGDSYARIAEQLNADRMAPKAAARWWPSGVQSVLLAEERRVTAQAVGMNQAAAVTRCADFELGGFGCGQAPRLRDLQCCLDPRHVLVGVERQC